ncbi:MAG: MFS transporter [Burkholderiales bacterium]
MRTDRAISPGVLRRAPGVVAFGLLHTVSATIGQTFVISLFLPGIKESFALGDAQVALLFTITTLASAVALWKIGPWIDRADVVRYSLSSGLFLAFACAVMAVARELAILVLGLFCLRLAGNGLLTHVALTATARYFWNARGTALSVILLGASLGEATLPAALVALIGVLGWRITLALTGAFGLALIVIAAASVWKTTAFRTARTPAPELGASQLHAARAGPAEDQRRYFTLTAPLFVGLPLVVTSTVFHQALVAEAKGVSLQWFAVSFIGFAVARVVSSMVSGPIVDRIGSTGLFCVHLLPLAGGTAALIEVSSPWVVPFYWVCAGVSNGLANVLQMTVVAERVAPERLGTARSMVAAAGIIASAAGPSLFGAGLAIGASVTSILWFSVTLLLAATVLGFFAHGSRAQAR